MGIETKGRDHATNDNKETTGEGRDDDGQRLLRAVACRVVVGTKVRIDGERKRARQRQQQQQGGG
jgi:hypothetical protein